MLVFISGMIAVAFFLTGYLYKAINWSLPGLLIQIINTLLGLFFAGALVGAAGQICPVKRLDARDEVFSPIIEALERIARGDFSVRSRDEFRG